MCGKADLTKLVCSNRLGFRRSVTISTSPFFYAPCTQDDRNELSGSQPDVAPDIAGQLRSDITFLFTASPDISGRSFF